MNTHLVLDVLVHVLILFTFLSMFFFTFVSKVEQKAFEEELGGMIEKNVTAALDSKKESILPYIDDIRPQVNTIKQLYVGPDRFGQATNKTIKISCIFVAVILISIISTIIVVGKDKVNILGILKENVITFFFVGIVEFWFFTNIAIKFIPTTPSLMVNTLYSSINDKLQ